MTDGEGLVEKEVCEELKDLSKKNNDLITFAVGFGSDYRVETLQTIVNAGNTKSKWLLFDKNLTKIL